VALRPRILRALSIVGQLALGTGSEAAAQEFGRAPARELPQWLFAWSPLNDIGTLPRHLPAATQGGGSSLLHPPERVGAFWSGANPAALPWEVHDASSDLYAARAGQSGEYRRPLDHGSARVTRLGGFGWQPLGARGAVVGGVLFDRTVKDPGPISNISDPYSSTPLVLVDTTTPALRVNRARLEGAGGWQFGDWGVGAALGYDTRRTVTVAAPLVRLQRGVLPASSVGVVRDLADGRLQLGVRAGWQGGEETVSLAPVGATGEMWQLIGYAEVPRIFVGPAVVRRISRRARSIGVGAAGSTASARWHVFAESERRHERESGAQSQDPPQDKWDTDGWTFGAAMQLPFLAERAMLTLSGRMRNVRGAAELHPARTGFASDETEASGRAEVRFGTASGAWSSVVRASVLRERRERKDSTADLRSETTGVTPGVAVEVGRRVVQPLTVIAGYALARYAGTGTIPLASAQGPIFQRVFAPELDIATSDILAHAFTGGLRWQTNGGNQLWLSATAEQLRPQSTDRFLAPSGRRNTHTVSMGVTLTPPGQ
jgi:hypothetical protein